MEKQLLDQPHYRINIDANDENSTTFTVLNSIHNFLHDNPVDSILRLYIVCGQQPPTEKVHWNTISNYLRSTGVKYIPLFRGILHVELLSLLFISSNFLISGNSYMKYTPKKLNLFLGCLCEFNREIGNRFIQQWMDNLQLNLTNRIISLDELKTWGIEFETF